MKKRIFSSFLSLVMILGLFPANLAFAEEVDVATVGDTPYKTLASAVEASDVENPVILINDAEISERISIDKEITIDLNGHNIFAEIDDAYGAIYIKKYILSLHMPYFLQR